MPQWKNFPKFASYYIFLWIGTVTGLGLWGHQILRTELTQIPNLRSKASDYGFNKTELIWVNIEVSSGILCIKYA